VKRVFVTGSADGLGRAAARTLLDDGQEVIVHVRSMERLAAVRELVDGGAEAVVGDLSDLEETRDVAAQVNRLGRMDAVIHNAGVISGPHILPVNVVAPYLLTALVHRPERLVYLSSDMHRGGRPDVDGSDWSGQRETRSYSDSKLFVTTLAVALARRWPDVYSNAVDPGWVPTKMGGSGAPDDLRLGHLTQEWLAVSDDPGLAAAAATGSISDAAGPTRVLSTHGSTTTCSLPWRASRASRRRPEVRPATSSPSPRAVRRGRAVRPRPHASRQRQHWSTAIPAGRTAASMSLGATSRNRARPRGEGRVQVAAGLRERRVELGSS
jgi:NAD(P)-dependent dehydrogenase (short-subunit alcohol dehydrogenase family)